MNQRALSIGSRVAVRDTLGHELRNARVVGVWRRDDAVYPTDAPTIKNAAYNLLYGTAAECVALLCSQGGVPMFVGRKGCLWFDCDGDPLQVKFEEAAHA